jgi:hypothetical protein
VVAQPDSNTAAARKIGTKPPFTWSIFYVESSCIFPKDMDAEVVAKPLPQIEFSAKTGKRMEWAPPVSDYLSRHLI